MAEAGLLEMPDLTFCICAMSFVHARCVFSQENVSWLAFMQGPRSTYKEAGGVKRGWRFFEDCMLLFTAATIGRISDLALL